MRRALRHFVVLGICLLPGRLTSGTINETQHRPRRIVSLNLCADQYLMAIADPGQITALTHLARDRAMSAGATVADHLPVSRGSAENVLALHPDLLVTSPSRRAGTRAILKGRYPMLELPPAKSYEDIVRQVREVAVAVGHRERGEALIRSMDQALARLPQRRPRGVAAYYQRRGYLTGAGTLVDELMMRMGLINLATKLGKPALSRVSLEEMTAARPDYIIVEDATERVTDLGTEMLHHPALDGVRRLHVPQAWTVCGGPAYVLAAQSLAQQLNER